MTKAVTRLSGVVPPMITPLTESGEIDSIGLERLINHLLDGGVSGIFALGSSGEGPWLTASQQTTVIKEVVRCVAGRVPVLAGALEPSTSRTQEAISRHADAGADMVVITSPYYFPSDESVQIKHIETLVESSPIPAMLYNIPPTTHNPIAPETVQQIMQLDNLVGIKDSAGDWDNFLKLLSYRADRPEFVVFQGAELLATRSIEAGADGIVPGLGNIVPSHFVAIIKAIQSGDPADAHAIQKRIDELWTLHTHDFWLIGLKYTASLLGFGSGAAIGHTMKMDKDAQQIIATLLEKVSS
jgi:4-hydroxy-tetrahydrodipicolinate synthase